MAVRISKIHGGKPIVNIYEVADDFMADERLSVKNFGTKATTEWANFVMNNRNRYYSDFANPLCNFDNKYTTNNPMCQSLYKNHFKFEG